MAVTKVNGFDAPYRSQTFQNQANAIEQTSGLLAIDGKISTSAGFVVVPPFSVIQNGLIIEESAQRSITDPAKPAPYFLTVSAATSAKTDDLSFTFPRSPSEISDTQVIIGYWDGVEWRRPQLVSIDGVNKDVNQGNLDYEREGPFSGLLTSIDGGNYVTDGGVLTDRKGLRQKLAGSSSIGIIPEDADFNHQRVDRIVYRRPNDSTNRIGMREIVLGGTHDVGVSLVKQTQFLNSTIPNSTVKVLIGSDNTAYLLVAEGYGNTFSIVYVKYSSDRTVELVAKTNLVNTDTANFTCCLDSGNNIHIVYTQLGNLYWSKFSSVGTVIVASALIFDHAYGSVANPSMVYNSELDALYVVSQVLLSVSNNKVFFQSFRNGSSHLVIKPPAQLPMGSGNLVHPDLFMNGDLDIYVVTEETSAHKIYLAKFDDTALVIEAVRQIFDVTTRIGYGVLSNTPAQKPRVFVTDNKTLIVTCLQDKGTSQYGLSIWSDGAAYMPTLFYPTENFTQYCACVDSLLNGVHLSVHTGTDVRYAKIEGQEVKLSTTLALVNAQGVCLTRDVRGSMLHAWSDSATSGFTSYDAGNAISYIGNQTLPSSITIGNDQFVVLQSLVTPHVGDEVVITGCINPGNNGTKSVTAVANVPVLSVNHWLVTVSPNFAIMENGTGSADFMAPNGNACSFVKTNSELTSLAYRFNVLSSDILLARLSLPGPLVLNYGDSTTGPVPSNTDKLIPYGSGVILDWGFSVPGAFKITGDLKILDLINNMSYTLDAGTYALNEGDALYVTLDLADTTPTPTVTPVATLPFSSPIQVLGVIKGGQFVPHALLTSLSVEPMDAGEVMSIGHDLPDMMRARLGIVSDTAYQPYDQANIILLEDNYPKAISRLDAALNDVQTDYNQEDVSIVASPITQYTSSTMTWDPDNSKYDVMVFLNGKKLTQGLTKDFYKFDVNILYFNFTIPATQELAIFKIRKGGGSAGFLVGMDEGVEITPYAKYLNFLGDGVVATNGGAGRINVSITGAAGQSTVHVKAYRNATGGTIPANRAVSFDSLGNIVLADANLVSLSDFVGITKQDITDLNYGFVYKLGDCPDVLTGMGAAPGDFIYLGETPGILSLTPPVALTDTIIIVGRAEPKNATMPDGTANTLYLNPQLVSGA